MIMRTAMTFLKYGVLVFSFTISGKSNLDGSTKNSVLDHLKKAGVDVNNYHDVCKYYGICENQI